MTRIGSYPANPYGTDRYRIRPTCMARGNDLVQVHWPTCMTRIGSYPANPYGTDRYRIRPTCMARRNDWDNCIGQPVWHREMIWAKYIGQPAFYGYAIDPASLYHTDMSVNPALPCYTATITSRPELGWPVWIGFLSSWVARVVR